MNEKQVEQQTKILEMWDARVKLRRWRLTSILFFIVLLMVLFGGSVTSDRKGPPIYGEYIARVNMEGMITTNLAFIRHLEAIANDNSVKAVLLHINSPGGTPVGGEMIYRALRKIANNKPVVALMDDMAASAGYMIALGADHIIAHKTTITASIGAVMYAPNFRQLGEKMGIEVESYKSSPLKAVPDPFGQTTLEAKQMIQDSVWDTYQTFVLMVHERRKLDPNQLLKVADGRMMTGNQALQAGLVDAIGGEEEALQWLEKVHNFKHIPPVYDLPYHEATPGYSLLGGAAGALQGLTALYKMSFARLWMMV
ncbi:MAG: signal peptide peptidase SppA [Proteobacteria bacterium]|nr:signal peptide peptidase SppA [Pseudomonadota bacterium]